MATYTELEYLKLLINQKQELQDKNNEFGEICDDPNCCSFSHYVKPAFATGEFRYAFKGRYCRGATKNGKNIGDKCVVKKFKKHHVFEKTFWQRDLKMSETAQELANAWNKLGKVSKKYIILQPNISRCGTEYTNALQHNEPQFGEQLLCEDYLDGKFEKWNSNSGWVNEDNIDSSIQAFCHWTYHYTDGNFLLCDAQGIRNRTNYIMTDPCILTNKVGRFGTTDCGSDYILNFFKYHQCNEFCETHWKKPSKFEIEMMDKTLKPVKRTSFAFETKELKQKQKTPKKMKKQESFFDSERLLNQLAMIGESDEE